MARIAPVLVGVLLLVAFMSDGQAVELGFVSGKSANLFWMVDQISRWDEHCTSPRYREYWESKVKLDDNDYAILEQYARLRRRLAQLEKREVRGQISPWVSLFGSSAILPHEQFALAFFESRTPKDAVALLNLSEAEQKIVVGTLFHFAKKFKDHYGNETAHLDAFAQKARILITLADAGGFINQMKSFFGVTGSLPETIPVNVLWGPPGFVQPARMGYHIILPVSVDKAESDEVVLQHLSMAIQQVAQYLVSKLPPETLADASRTILRECGYINAPHPTLIRRALQVAMGEILFLRQRFPDLPVGPVLVPWEAEFEYPYAMDELARAFGEQLTAVFDQGGGFYPGFVTKAVEVHKKLFTPRPRFFAGTGFFFGDSESRELFSGLFRNVDRLDVMIDKPGSLIELRKREPDRAVFLVVTAQNATNMYQVLKRITKWRDLTAKFRGLKKSSYIFPIKAKNKGTIFVVHGLDDAAVRKALIKLYTMEEMPTKPVVIR